MTEVFLNGKFVGEVENAEEFIENFKNERRQVNISYQVNIRHDEDLNQVLIESSRGRVMRPVIIVKEGIPLLTDKHIKQLQRNEINWNDLLQQGIVEFLDASEEENRSLLFRPSLTVPVTIEREFTMGDHSHSVW